MKICFYAIPKWHSSSNLIEKWLSYFTLKWTFKLDPIHSYRISIFGHSDFCKRELMIRFYLLFSRKLLDNHGVHLKYHNGILNHSRAANVAAPCQYCIIFSLWYIMRNFSYSVFYLLVPCPIVIDSHNIGIRYLHRSYLASTV